jgi:hypothetical protein
MKSLQVQHFCPFPSLYGVQNGCGPRYAAVKRGGDLPGGIPEAADPFRIPEVMEVAGAEAIRDDAFPIYAGIVI